MTDEANVSRRDLVLNATAAARWPPARSPRRTRPRRRPSLPAHWTHEADVVVIGSGATGLPAAIVAREAGASVIVVEAENAYRRPRHHQRRQRPARRRHQRAEAARHRGLARSAVPRPDRLVGGRAERLSRLPLQRSRDHPRLRRQQRRHLSNGWSRTAWSSSTRRRTRAAATRSATRCRARCTPPSWTGRWCRPASRPIRRCRPRRPRATG